MTKRRSPSLVVFVLLLLAAIPAFTQNSNYSTDCEAARQALSINNPGQLAPCSPSASAASKTHGLTTKQMMQMQVASTVIDAFVNMLFSNDSQANAQKQKMMAELQARQLQAERQKQHEEALRLAAICGRLQTTLKLSGLPQLQFKSSSGAYEGLRLKLGDDSDTHVGVPGLPGIALNDNTGDGGGTPYGIPGLPGIYTNGPATPATAPSGNNPQPGTGGLALKVGDGSDSSSRLSQQAQASPSAQSGLVIDPRTMTPQQLADLASNLPPEQQQQLLNALQAGSSANAPATPVSSVDASSPAVAQLQQTSAASNAATVAATPEGAASNARIGFDQAAVGSLPVSATNGGGLAPLASSNAQPSTVAATGTSSHSAASPAIPTTVNSAVLAPPSMSAASSGPVSSTSSVVATGSSPSAPAPSRIPQMTNQQLLDETCRARAMLQRIGADSQNGSQKLDEMAKEIRQTRREAVKAGLGCFSELAKKTLSDKFENKLDGEEERTHSAAFEKDAKEFLKKAQDLQTEISKTTLEYQENDRAREEKLQAALKYMNAFYEYVHKGKAFPWVASAQCAIDFSYLATKVYAEEQQISLLNNNQDGAAGSLRAENSVAAFHKKLVDESLRRGLDPKAACH